MIELGGVIRISLVYVKPLTLVRYGINRSCDNTTVIQNADAMASWFCIGMIYNLFYLHI